METMSSKQEQRLHGEHELQMSKTEKSEQNDREIAAFLTKYGDLWSVRPIEIFAEIHDFQGFAGLHPLFFGVFAAMAVDFPPEGQF